MASTQLKATIWKTIPRHAPNSKSNPSICAFLNEYRGASVHMLTIDLLLAQAGLTADIDVMKPKCKLRGVKHTTAIWWNRRRGKEPEARSEHYNLAPWK